MDASPSLFERLRDTYVDDERTLMDVVSSSCSVETLATLSAVSRWHREDCRTRLRHAEWRWTRVRQSEDNDLARRLCCSNFPLRSDFRSDPWYLLADIGCLTIPETLPHHLRPLLGKWLQKNGRLAHVTSVRCKWFVRVGEVIGWIELDETFRDGKPECMTAEERFTLNTLDTSDGLLKTVLKNVESKA